MGWLRRSAVLIVVLAAVAAGRQASTADRGTRFTKPFSFAVLEDYDKGDDLARVKADFGIIRDLGANTWRGSLGWDDYEPEPGHPDLAWVHAFATTAAESGITLRPYLGYTPAWASAGGTDHDVWNDPPRDTAAWAGFVREITSELAHHRNVASIEIYNEENVPQWWDGTPAQYAQVLREGARVARTVAPALQVLIGGLVFPDTRWLEQICTVYGARDFDVLPVHAYPETWTPKEVTVETYLGPGFEPHFVQPADRACGHKAIWINETGFATVPGRSEEDQAGWWVRAMATFAAEPRVEQVGVYEIHDPPLDRPVIGDAPNYHLGLIGRDGHRKTAYATVRRMIALLGGGRLTVLDPELRVHVKKGSNSSLYCHAFERTDGGITLVAWAKSVRTTIDVVLPRAAARAIEYSVNGEAAGTYPVNGREMRFLALTPDVPRIFAIAR